MVENLIVGVICLLAGGVGGKATKWIENRNAEDQSANLAIAKLSAGVEHIAAELTAIREDMRTDRRELFSRLGTAEQRIARLEATKRFDHDT
jgi:hypothetical protein